MKSEFGDDFFDRYQRGYISRQDFEAAFRGSKPPLKKGNLEGGTSDAPSSINGKKSISLSTILLVGAAAYLAYLAFSKKRQ